MQPDHLKASSTALLSSLMLSFLSVWLPLAFFFLAATVFRKSLHGIWQQGISYANVICSDSGSILETRQRSG